MVTMTGWQNEGDWTLNIQKLSDGVAVLEDTKLMIRASFSRPTE